MKVRQILDIWSAGIGITPAIVRYANSKNIDRLDLSVTGHFKYANMKIDRNTIGVRTKITPPTKYQKSIVMKKKKPFCRISFKVLAPCGNHPKKATVDKFMLKTMLKNVKQYPINISLRYVFSPTKGSLLHHALSMSVCISHFNAMYYNV